MRLFTSLNNKLFSHELKMLNYDGLWENKNIPDENQHFDWIKLIHGHRYQLLLLDDLTCLTIIRKTKHRRMICFKGT